MIYLASALDILRRIWSNGSLIFLKRLSVCLYFLIALLHSEFHKSVVLCLLFLDLIPIAMFAALSIMLEKSLTIVSICSWVMFTLRSIGFKIKSCSMSSEKSFQFGFERFYLRGGSYEVLLFWIRISFTSTIRS